MDYKQIMTDYLSKTLGKTDAEITAILHKKADDGSATDEISDTALQDLETAHADHIEAAPADKLKQEYNRGHKEGTFSAKSKAQERIEKIHGIKAKTLEEAEDMLAAKAAQDASTEDAVKIHPVYTTKIAELEDQLERERTEGQAKIQEVEIRVARKERFAAEQPKFEVWLKDIGAVMPTNPNAAATLKRLFQQEIEQFDIDPQQTGTYLKKADGTLEKDKHGNPVRLETYVKEKATEYFDIEKQPGRDTPGLDNPGTPPPQKWGKENLPKSKEEFGKVYYQTPVAEKAELMSAWTAANPQG